MTTTSGPSLDDLSPEASANKPQTPPEPTIREPSVEEFAAHIISEQPAVVLGYEDNYDGAGDESALAMARAHVYRYLSGLSYTLV